MKVFYKGIVESITKTGIILELKNLNLGIYINTQNSTNFKVGGEFKIFIYEYFINNYKFIYGFNTYEERSMFIDLLKVNKIGPKIAANICSQINYYDFKQIILNQDLVKIKNKLNISDKIATGLMIELKSKYTYIERYNDKKIEIRGALLKIGYKKNQIETVLNSIELKADSIEENIKLAIQKIGINLKENNAIK